MFYFVCLNAIASVAFAARILSPFSPSISGNTEGTVVVSWSGLDGGKYVIQQASLIQGEMAWSSPSFVSSQNLNALSPQLMLNESEDTLFVWLSFNGSYFQVYGASSTLGQAPFSVEALSSAQSDSPKVSLDESGYGVAVWQESSQTDMIAAATYSPMTGWSPSEYLTTSLQSAENPDLTIDPSSGNAVAVWEADHTIQAAYLPFGKGWGRSADISQAELDAANPQVTSSPSGEMLAIWQATINNARAIQLSSYIGRSWTEAVTLSVSGFHLFNPRVIFTPSGESAALISEMNDLVNNKSYILTAIRDEEGDWNSLFILNTDEQAIHPSIGFNDAHQAIAIWENEGVIRAALRSAGGVWGMPTSLSSGTFDSSFPVLYMDNSEYAVAAWQARDSTGAVLYQAAILPSFSMGWTTAQTISD